MVTDEIWSKFSELLKERFSKDVHSTEDSIRYLFFYTLTNHGNFTPNEIIVEQPHPNMQDARIDAFIPQSKDTQSLAFEFKYHKERKRTSPTSNSSAKLFKDMFRLKSFEEDDKKIDRYLVYVTNIVTHNYLENRKGILKKWYTSYGEEVRIDESELESRAGTQWHKKLGPIHPCTVKNIFKSELPGNRFLIITQIF